MEASTSSGSRTWPEGSRLEGIDGGDVRRERETIFEVQGETSLTAQMR